MSQRSTEVIADAVISCPESITRTPAAGYLRYHEFFCISDSFARGTRHKKEGRNMANNNEDVPFMQKLLDNHFLLLFLGVASPGVLYILWGIVDIMSVPLAK